MVSPVAKGLLIFDAFLLCLILLGFIVAIWTGIAQWAGTAGILCIPMVIIGIIGIGMEIDAEDKAEKAGRR